MKELSRATATAAECILVKELEALQPGDSLTVRRHPDDPTRKEFVVTVRTFGDGNSPR